MERYLSNKLNEIELVTFATTVIFGNKEQTSLMVLKTL